MSGNDLTAYCAAKPYSFVPVNNYTDLLYPSLVKWLDPNRPDMQYQPGSRNWVKMRFAETYLILAEAYGRKGDFAKAENKYLTDAFEVLHQLDRVKKEEE